MEFRLVKVVVQLMGDVFPELRQHEAHIRDIIAEEEASFGMTLLNVSLSFCLHAFSSTLWMGEMLSFIYVTWTRVQVYI